MGGYSTASSSGSSCSSSSSSSGSSSSSSSSTASSDVCPYVHIDNDWCPGTRKLREVAREVAEENDCSKYSKKISKQILKEMDGMFFFRVVSNNTDDDDSSSSGSDSSDSDSDSDDDSSTDKEYGFGCFTEEDEDEIDLDDEDEVEEIPPKELHKAIKPFYEGERFLIENEAHCRDVYFNHPNHPGTQAFVRASQAAVIKLGVKRGFDKRVFNRMKRLLYDSDYFIGTAPKCKEAEEEDYYEIFRARYEFDRIMMRRVMADRRKPRSIPGSSCIKRGCCENKDPDKKHCMVKIIGCVPKAVAAPVVGALAFVGFGFLYFTIWFILKTIITAIYVAIGLSLSFMFGGTEIRPTEAPTMEPTAAPTTLAPSVSAIPTTLEPTELVEIFEDRYIRKRL